MSETRDERMRELVHRLASMAPPPPPFPDEPAALPPRRPVRALAAAAAVLVVALIGGVLYATRDDGDGSQISAGGDTTENPPPLGDVGPVLYADRNGVWLNGARVADGPACCPAWSSDGASYAYERDDTLYAHLDGETRVAEHVIRWAWSPSDPVLAVVTDTGDNAALSLHRVEGDHVVNTQTIDGADDFAWSPDGDMLVYARAGRADALWVLDVLDGARRSSEPRELAVEAGDFDGFALASWSPDGTHVLAWRTVASASITADGEPLVAIDLATGTTTPMNHSLRRRSWIQWSPDGTSFLAVESTGRMVADPREVVRCTITGGCTSLGLAHQTTDPAWSPDGTRIAFVTNAAPTNLNEFKATDGEVDWPLVYAQRELWLANADGSDARRVDAAGGGVAVPRWIDGDRITFVRNGRLWLVTLSTGTLEALTPVVELADDPTTAVSEPTELNTRWRWDNAFAWRTRAPAVPVPPTVGSATSVVVPKVMGLASEEAARAVEAVGLSPVLLGATGEAVEPADGDGVVWQEPPAGARVGSARPVFLYVCPAAADCVVPPPGWRDSLEPAIAFEPFEAERFGGPFGALDAAEAALIEQLTNELGSEGVILSSYIQPATPTSIWVSARNVGDDSADGYDYRFEMVQTERGWDITAAESRVICSRGKASAESCV